MQKTQGFSLIELIIVIALVAVAMIGILAYRPTKKTGLFDAVAEINTITQKACANALLNQTIYQLRFFFDEDMRISHIGFAPVHTLDNVGSEKIAPQDKQKITVPCIAKSLIIEGNNELSRSGTRETWLLLYPEGYTQEAEMELFNDNKTVSLRLFLNPFLGVFQTKDNA